MRRKTKQNLPEMNKKKEKKKKREHNCEIYAKEMHALSVNQL